MLKDWLCRGLALGCLLATSGGQAGTITPTDIFINEFHYDNKGIDTGERVEIAGPAGTPIDKWLLLLYNGATGKQYNSITLSGTFADQWHGLGFLVFDTPGLQNGAPDGMALVDPGGQVVQFLSYEGVFTAVNGVASGLTSTDVGVRESNDSTPEGWSLQLDGTGTTYTDFRWSGPRASTFGAANVDQTLSPVPLPASLWLFGSGLVGLLGLGRWRRRE